MSISDQYVKQTPREFTEQFLLTVETNYANPHFSFTMELHEFEMSRSTFARRVQKEYDCTPQVFLRNYRLEKAFEMLQKVEIEVAVIAESCGFNNLSYFNRTFKMKYGKTPTNLIKINTHK